MLCYGIYIGGCKQVMLLLKSILMGIAIAAPVGPMAVLCVNRTLNYGILAGVIIGLGIATADAIYCCVSGFGLTFISSFLLSHQFIIRVVGGIFLCYLGFKAFLKSRADASVKDDKKSFLSEYASAFGRYGRWSGCILEL